MSFHVLPYASDIRAGSRVQWGDLDWVVLRVQVHDRAGVWVVLEPPKNRPGKNSCLVSTVLLNEVRLLP